MTDIFIQDCPDGTFGFYCNETCSSGCNQTCSKMNGFCECKQGYKSDANNICKQSRSTSSKQINSYINSAIGGSPIIRVLLHVPFFYGGTL